MTRYRLAFMGTPDFAVPGLAALLEAGHDVAAVYSQPARPAGRGRKTRPSPVQAFAESRGIDVRTPGTLRDTETQDAFAELDLDLAIVAAYGLILPEGILEAPRLGCLNIHASLLPRWRGAAPIQRAILAGDRVTGISIMRMEAGLDTGPVYLAAPTPIEPGMTAGELHDRLAALGGKLIIEALAGLVAGELQPWPQNDADATYAKKIEKAEARIDWSRPAAEVARQIQAFAPWPGAWCDHDGTRLKLLAAALEEPEAPDGSPGEALDDRLLVACGSGALRVTQLQREGRRLADATEYLRGHPVTKGIRLT